MSIKIIVKEWLWNPLDFFVISSFFSFFASDRAQRSIRQVYHFKLTEQTDRNIELIYSFTTSEQKTKIAHGQGPSKINDTHSTVVFNFDVTLQLDTLN